MLNIIFDMFSKILTFSEIIIKLSTQMILKEKLIFLEVQNEEEFNFFSERKFYILKEM